MLLSTYQKRARASPSEYSSVLSGEGVSYSSWNCRPPGEAKEAVRPKAISCRSKAEGNRRIQVFAGSVNLKNKTLPVTIVLLLFLRDHFLYKNVASVYNIHYKQILHTINTDHSFLVPLGHTIMLPGSLDQDFQR